MFSADWRAYLASGLRVHGWMLSLIEHWREVLFSGFLLTTLAVYTCVTSWRPRRAGTTPAIDGTAPVTVGFYTSLALLAVWASFGPAAGLYAWLYHTVPLLSFLRAPARWGVFATLSISVLAGIGVGH